MRPHPITGLVSSGMVGGQPRSRGYALQSRLRAGLLGALLMGCMLRTCVAQADDDPGSDQPLYFTLDKPCTSDPVNYPFSVNVLDEHECKEIAIQFGLDISTLPLKFEQQTQNNYGNQGNWGSGGWHHGGDRYHHGRGFRRLEDAADDEDVEDNEHKADADLGGVSLRGSQPDSNETGDRDRDEPRRNAGRSRSWRDKDDYWRDDYYGHRGGGGRPPSPPRPQMDWKTTNYPPGCWWSKLFKEGKNSQEKETRSLRLNKDETVKDLSIMKGKEVVDYYFCKFRKINCCPPTWFDVDVNSAVCGHDIGARSDLRKECNRQCRNTFGCEGFDWTPKSCMLRMKDGNKSTPVEDILAKHPRRKEIGRIETANITINYSRATHENKTILDRPSSFLGRCHRLSCPNGWKVVLRKMENADKNFSDVQDLMACAQSCEVRPSCADFLWYEPEKKCWLRSVGSLDEIAVPKNADDWGLHCERAAPSCYKTSNDPGKWLNVTEIATERDCAWLCDQEERCDTFSYTRSNKRCILQELKPYLNDTMAFHQQTFLDEDRMEVNGEMVGDKPPDLLFYQDYRCSHFPLERELGLPLGFGVVTKGFRTVARTMNLITCPLSATEVAEMGVLLDSPQKVEAHITYLHLTAIVPWLAVIAWMRHLTVTKEASYANQTVKKKQASTKGDKEQADKGKAAACANDSNKATCDEEKEKLLPQDSKTAEEIISPPKVIDMSASKATMSSISSMSTTVDADPAPQVTSKGEIKAQDWGITRPQLEGLLLTLRKEPSWHPSNTIHDLVDGWLRPWTAGKGVGYALMLNCDEPKQVNVMVVHAWDGNAEEFLELLIRSIAPDDVVFSAALSMYHCEDNAGPSVSEQMGPELTTAPSVCVIKHIAAKGTDSISGCWETQLWLPVLPRVLLLSAAWSLLFPCFFGCLPGPDWGDGRLPPLSNIVNMSSWDCWSLGNQDVPMSPTSNHWVFAACAADHGCAFSPKYYPVLLVLSAISIIGGAAVGLLVHTWPRYKGRVLVIPNYECDMWRRLWCIYEIVQAWQLGVPTELANSMCTLRSCDSFSLPHPDTRSGVCASPADEERIRAEFERLVTDRVVKPHPKRVNWCSIRLCIECLRCCVEDADEWNNNPGAPPAALKDWTIYTELDYQIDYLQDRSQTFVGYTWLRWISVYWALMVADFGLRFHYDPEDTFWPPMTTASIALIIRFLGIFWVGSLVGNRSNGRVVIKYTVLLFLFALVLNLYSYFSDVDLRSADAWADKFPVLVTELAMAIEFTFLPMLLVGYVCGEARPLPVLATVFAFFMLDPYIKKEPFWDFFTGQFYSSQVLVAIQLFRHILLPHMQICDYRKFGLQLRTWGLPGDKALSRRRCHESDSMEREKGARARRLRSKKQKLAAKRSRNTEGGSAMEIGEQNTEVHAQVHLLNGNENRPYVAQENSRRPSNCAPGDRRPSNATSQDGSHSRRSSRTLGDERRMSGSVQLEGPQSRRSSRSSGFSSDDRRSTNSIPLDGAPPPRRARRVSQDGTPVRRASTTGAQDGTPARRASTGGVQDGTQVRRASTSGAQGSGGTAKPKRRASASTAQEGTSTRRASRISTPGLHPESAAEQANQV